MEENNTLEPPQSNTHDVAYAILKGVIATVPAIGGVGAEVFNLIITPPLEKRRDEWIQTLVENLVQLQNQVDGFKLEELSDNDEFISATLQASQIAVRHHRDEKLRMLQAGLLNIASGNSPEEDIATMFLNYIDILTVSHIRLLKFLYNPEDWATRHEIPVTDSSFPFTSIDEILEKSMPEFKGKKAIYQSLVRDLYNRNLVQNASIGGVMSTGRTVLKSRTTTIGNDFVKFIISPLKS